MMYDSSINYQELMEDEFPELWDEDGETATGFNSWTGVGEFLDIELKDKNYNLLKKEIYEYLKEHPEMISFIIL